MKPAKTILGILTISALMLPLPAPAQAATTRILMNCFFPPQHFMCQKILPAWKDNVEQATEGRVKIRFPAQSVASPPEQLAAVRTGIVDAALQMNGFMANEVVGPMVGMTPFSGTSDARANSIALWRTYDRFLSAKDEFEGVTVLGLIAAPGADFYSTTDTPITTFASALNRKMWALPGVTSSMLKDNGGSVVSGPATQMTEIIQRGVVDGFVGIPAAESIAFNVLPYAKSVTRTRQKIFTAIFSVFISDAKWAEISPDDQKAVMGVSGEALAELAGGIWGGVEAKVLMDMESTTKVIEATPDFEKELIAASKPYVGKWIESANKAGFDGQAAYDFYVSEVVKLTK